MKIHEFAKYHKVSVRTLRYYAQINLLIPSKKDGQLFFDEACKEDFLLIEQLKKSGFFIKEITQWLEYQRAASLNHNEIFNYQKNLLLKVKSRLITQERRIQMGIHAADSELENVRKHPSHCCIGIHVDFLDYLCCPHCDKALTYEQTRIVGKELREGKAFCQCGYKALIRNGIFIADNGGKESIVPIDTKRETYGRLKPDGINMLQKNFYWLLKKLQSQSLKDKVIFENFVNTICFSSTGIEFLDTAAYYIVADSDYQVISDIKARIEALDIPVKILFLVNDDLDYPIRKHSVDIVLDYFHSEIIQGFGRASLEEAMLPYVHPGSMVAGIYTYIKKGKKTLEKNRKMFPNSYKERFLLPAFKSSMERCKLKTLDTFDKNILTYSVIESYGEGDILGEYCFFSMYQ